ncbi:MAG: DUF1552 domain-containing protein [Acidobacteriota bacterium]|nr:DUF1552 domain-containing protein [Acidobacteriota bacterium]
MIITKKALPRRTFLRGAGTALALPLLDAMVPALSAVARTAANPVKRLGFLYLPNGVAMNHTGIDYWKPVGEGTGFELSPILKPLEPYRSRLVTVSGLSHGQAESLGDGNGDHTRSTATWLNGVHPNFTQGADVRAGVTADQLAAAEFGKETPLPSIELAVDLNFLVGNCDNGYSCTYLNTLAWRTATTPLPTENNPRAVFERMFGDGGTPAQRLAQVRKDRSILDAVEADMQRLYRRVGAADRARTDEYFDAVREVERRLQKAEISPVEFDPDAGLERPPVGIPDSFGDHVRLMFDLQWLAYQADITRVFTFMYGREVGSRTYPEIGLAGGHHAMSHHGDRPEALERYARLNTYQTDLFRYFVDRLASTPDGDGTLLDHALLLYGAGMSNPNIHSHNDIPLVLVGGASGHLQGGRHLVAPLKTPMTNLLVSMLDKSGVQVDRLGDNTGRLDLGPVPEPLSGV